MVTMAQRAANWCSTHTNVDHSHSLTHLRQHSYNHVVRSASSAVAEFGIKFLFLKAWRRARVPGENSRQPARLSVSHTRRKSNFPDRNQTLTLQHWPKKFVSKTYASDGREGWGNEASISLHQMDESGGVVEVCISQQALMEVTWELPNGSWPQFWCKTNQLQEINEIFVKWFDI